MPIPPHILDILRKDQLHDTESTANYTPERRNLWRSLNYNAQPPTPQDLIQYKATAWQSDPTLVSIALLLQALASATRITKPWPLGVFPSPSEKELIRFCDIMVGSLARHDITARHSGANALLALLDIAPVAVATKYLNIVITASTPSQRMESDRDRLGMIYALGLIFPLCEKLQKHKKPSDFLAMHPGIDNFQDKIIDILLRLTINERNVEIKCAALQSLASGPMVHGGKLRSLSWRFPNTHLAQCTPHK